MKNIFFSTLLAISVFSSTQVVKAIDSEDRPIGWSEMSEAEQNEFTEMLSGFVDQQSALKKTPQEFAELSKAEKKAHNQALKSLEVDFVEALSDGGYVLERQASARVAAASSDAPPAAAAAAPPAAGTITYDTGTDNGGGTNAPSSFMVGNHFDTSNGDPVETTGTISRMTVFMRRVDGNTSGSGNAFISVYSNVSGTSAAQVTSASVPLQAGAFNTHTFAPPLNYAGGNFLAGVWQFDGSADDVGVDPGTVSGQGHHGIFINDIVGTGLADLETTGGNPLNAMVRVSGGDLIPVELMKFEIKTESADSATAVKE